MKDSLIEFVSQQLLDVPSHRPLHSSDDLLSSGMLDSMGVMRLVDHIEQLQGVRIPPEDITLENFISIDAIMTYLQKLLDR